MLGNLKKAMGGSRYEKVTTVDEHPAGAFAIDDDDDIDKLSALHRDLVVRAQAEIQEAESNVSQLLMERQAADARVRALLSDDARDGPARRRWCCCRRLLPV